jgi:chromosome condensin MukBEF ATPase and DNA-binding subunit MukB
VETRTLKQAVRRNIDRFPDDFMFVLSKEEFNQWKSQSVISKGDKMGLRHPPMAFTEQGVAMLSGVLKSDRAIKVNIAIMRTFVHMREMLASHEQLHHKLEELEAKYDEQFGLVFQAIRRLLTEEEKPKRRIGF